MHVGRLIVVSVTKRFLIPSCLCQSEQNLSAAKLCRVGGRSGRRFCCCSYCFGIQKAPRAALCSPLQQHERSTQRTWAAGKRGLYPCAATKVSRVLSAPVSINIPQPNGEQLCNPYQNERYYLLHNWRAFGGQLRQKKILKRSTNGYRIMQVLDVQPIEAIKLHVVEPKLGIIVRSSPTLKYSTNVCGIMWLLDTLPMRLSRVGVEVFWKTCGRN